MTGTLAIPVANKLQGRASVGLNTLTSVIEKHTIFQFLNPRYRPLPINVDRLPGGVDRQLNKFAWIKHIRIVAKFLAVWVLPTNSRWHRRGRQMNYKFNIEKGFAPMIQGASREKWLGSAWGDMTVQEFLSMPGTKDEVSTRLTEFEVSSGVFLNYQAIEEV